MSERCDDELKEAERDEECRSEKNGSSADCSGRVLVAIREAMGSSKHQCTLRATYIQFRISEIIDARKRSTEIKKAILKHKYYVVKRRKR